MKKLTFLIGLLLSWQLLANPVKLLHFTVDISESYGEIFGHYDKNGDIDYFTWVITHPQDENDPGESDTFTAQDVRNGTVFKSGLPKRFVKVWGDNFSSINGGEINIRVPQNIVIGKHTFEKVLIDRLGDQWEVNHTSKDQVKKVHLLVKKFLGLPIGITGFKFID